MNKNRENFIKYTNDLYFHHLLVENEKIRTLICQELVLDKKIISTKLKNPQQYGKSYYEKKLILDVLAVDDVGDIYNIELQTYGLNEEILVRFELYNAELLRQQVKIGEDYTNAHIVRSMIIFYGHYLKEYPFYKCTFKMHDPIHHVDYPFNRQEITIIQLDYIDQVIDDMTSFNQLMYLFKNEKAYDKIEPDKLVKEAIQMHDKYISSEESYQEYLDRLDNEMLLRSRDRKIEEANKQLKSAHKEIEIANSEMDNMLDKTKENIIKYVEMKFHDNIRDFINTLSKKQILDIQDNLYNFTNIKELKNSTFK